MKKLFFLLLTILIVGCASNNTKDDIRKINNDLVTMNARLKSIENDLYEIHDYISKKHDADNVRYEKLKKFDKELQEQLTTHDGHIKTLMPIYQNK